MPRICFLTAAFPPVEGGQEIHAYELSETLVGMGLELFVVTRKTNPRSAACERVGEVEVIRLPPSGDSKGTGWRAVAPVLLFMLRALWLLIKRVRRYDIVMVSGFNLLPTIAVLLSIFANKKSLVRIESPIELREAISGESLGKMKLSHDSPLVKAARWLRGIVTKRGDCFVAISAEIRRALIDMGVEPHKIASIPNGIDTHKFRPVAGDIKTAIRQRLSLPLDKTIFIFTGRLAVSKGVLLLIEVWKDLARKYGDIHLVLVGTGKDSFDRCDHELGEYVKLNSLQQSVTLTGKVDNVQEYLQASDIFVFPSDYEGFGLSILEALACGLAVVTTRVGVAPEVIRNHENGILIDPRDQRQLKAEFEWLLDNEDARRMIMANAREGIAAKYSMDAVAEEYIKAFSALEGCKQRNPLDHINNQKSG